MSTKILGNERPKQTKADSGNLAKMCCFKIVKTRESKNHKNNLLPFAVVVGGD
jgi:hypothetical protein